MALYSNNVLLGALGGPQYQQAQQDPTRQQIDSIRDYAKSALGAQLPQTMYSPWQGAGYLLDKFQGRNEADRANELQKSALLQALSGTAATPAPSPMTTGSIDQSQGQAQPAAQPQAAAPVAQPPIAAQMKPTIAPDTGAGQGNAALAGAAKLVIGPIDGHGPDSEVTPQQIAGGLPDGYKVKSIIGADGSTQPAPDTAQTAPAAPVAMPNPEPAPQQPSAAPQQSAGGAPQASPIETGSNAQGPGGLTIGPPPLPKPIPSNVLQHIMALEPEDQKTILDRYEASQKVQQVDTGLGIAWQTPDGRKGFLPKSQITASQFGDGISLPNVVTGTPQGGASSKLLIPGANTGLPSAGGAPSATGQGAGGAGGAGQGAGGPGGVSSIPNTGNPMDTVNYFAQNKAANEARAAAAKEGAVGIVKSNQEGLSKIGATLPDAEGLVRSVQQLQSLEKIPALANASTGPYSGEIQQAKKFINNFLPGTIDQESLAAADTYNKVSTLMATGLAKQLTNRPTQYDFKTFLERATPNFSTSPEARRSVLNMYEMQANEQLAKAQTAQGVFQKGGTLQDYNSKMNDWYDAHPLTLTYNGKELTYKANHVAPDDPTLLQGAEKSASPDPLEGKTATGPNGQKLVRKDGKWVSP